MATKWVGEGKKIRSRVLASINAESRKDLKPSWLQRYGVSEFHAYAEALGLGKMEATARVEAQHDTLAAYTTQ